MSELNKAWLAGFFEGDGCVTSYHGKSPRIFIGQKYRYILDVSREISNMGHIGLTRSPTTKWVYGVYSYNDVLRFCNYVYPYLQSESTDIRENKKLKMLKLVPNVYTTPKEMTQELKLSWLAGYFEAEGCVSKIKGCIRIKAKDDTVLHKIKNITGVGGVLGPYGGITNYGAVWYSFSYQADSKYDRESFCNAIMPYMKGYGPEIKENKYRQMVDKVFEGADPFSKMEAA